MGLLDAAAALVGARTPACALCGARLGVLHRIDSQGRRFCLGHNPGSLCPECGRLEARPTPDGANLCPACATSGVDREGHARSILTQVRGDLHGLGFQLPEVPIPIQLIRRGELNPQAAGKGEASCEGRVAWRRWGDGTLEVLGMWIQRGLPPVSTGRIIAHELGHLWLAMVWDGERTALKAEGTCELCSWLWLTARRRPQAGFKAAAMDRNPDPIYGEGFRAARRRYQAGGMAALGQWFKEG